MSNFLTRTITGAVYVIVLVGSVLLAQPYAFAVLIAFLVTVGINEFYSLLPSDKYQPNKILGITIGLLVFALVFAYSVEWFTNVKLFWLALPASWLVFIWELYRKKTNPFQNIALTFLAVIYIAIPFSLLYLSGFIHESKIWANQFNHQFILGFFFLLWTSDTGAYLVGITLGKHPLFPRISPKKSWEGFWGGVLFTLLVAWIISRYFNSLSPTNWFIIAAIIAVFGVLGDLIESLLKRSLHVKDSGTILPGHGGILDRFDSVLFAAPLVFFYVYLFS